jgi:hypothetical protein
VQCISNEPEAESVNAGIHRISTNLDGNITAAEDNTILVLAANRFMIKGR